MAVDSVSGALATSATQTSESKKDAEKASLDYDAFLQLLVAQMQNQDPLNPTDSTEQLAQLASFSNVEQSIKVNEKLESILSMSSLSQADNVLGRTISNSDGSVKGVVKSVTTSDAGAIATLDNGKTLAIGPGIKIE